MSETENETPWAEDPRGLLRAGEGFSLAAMDRGGKPGFDGKKADGKAFAAERGELLSELQERLYAEGRDGGSRSVLVVVQGLDTAGKGGIARHVMAMVDPQGVALRSFGVPTKEEADHHFLWRIKKALPPAGKIGVFDRSHYEDVLIHRVDGLTDAETIDERYEEINAFEKDLVDNGTVVLKFALLVSHDEQGLRLMERLDRPDKRWKFSANDLTTRSKWDAYQEAYQLVFERTSTDHAPWYVIPADRKWYSRVAITEILTQTMVEMDLGWPQPDWDHTEMREQLAEQMSAAALKESLKETEENVVSALKDSAEVERESLEVYFGPDADRDPVEAAEEHAALAQVDANKASWLAELARTRDQKATLVERATFREKHGGGGDGE